MLREQLIELAHEKPRFGYRRLHILLRRSRSARLTTNECSGCIVPQGFAFDASGASD